VPLGALITTEPGKLRVAEVIVSPALRPANVTVCIPVNVIPEISVRLPCIVTPVVRFSAGVPVVPVKSIDRPSLGISAVTVRPAMKALLITTSSCGNGTRLVHPCVDQVKLAVPVAVWVALTVAFVVTAPALPRASPMYALPAFVHDAPPE